MPKIIYDKSKCLHPEECMICVKTCPKKVLMLAPAEKPKSPGSPPSRYIIYPMYDVLCDKCGLCLENCPKNAITIK
ncbi:MAG: hypothetical protein DRZ80_03395 [Thermoprotei archaeon]|nr:MAG: hypothetical protein DRZ80_03395 [Thermoprotei archaeon]